MVYYFRKARLITENSENIERLEKEILDLKVKNTKSEIQQKEELIEVLKSQKDGYKFKKEYGVLPAAIGSSFFGCFLVNGIKALCDGIVKGGIVELAISACGLGFGIWSTVREIKKSNKNFETRHKIQDLDFRISKAEVEKDTASELLQKLEETQNNFA